MELQQPFYERVMRPTIQRFARVGRRQDGGMIARTDAKLEKAGYPGGLRGADWIGVKFLSLIAFAILGFAARPAADRHARRGAAVRPARRRPSDSWRRSSGSVAGSAGGAWP